MSTIVVVDDIAVNRELLVAFLAPHGHRIIEAGDGQTALALVEAERPALVICDILMPEMDGYAFVRALRTRPAVADTPVVFCTAHFLDPEALKLAEFCGVDQVLTKPINPDALYRAVAEVLAGKAPPGRSPPPMPDTGFERRHLHLISGKLSEKVEQLQQANDKLAALIDLNLQLASQPDRSSLLEHVCASARQLLGADFGTIAVRDAGDSTQTLVRHCAALPDAAEIASVDLERGALGEVVREAHVLRLHLDGEANHEIDPASAASASAPLGVASSEAGAAAKPGSGNSSGQTEVGLPDGYPRIGTLLAAPVKSLAMTYGWLVLANRPGGAGFAEGDAELLRILAAQTGRIYENGSLYARLCQHTSELEAEIVERERGQHHLAVQYAVARVLNESHDLTSAAPAILEAICTELGFAAATLWRVVDEHGTRCLHCLGVHTSPGAFRARFETQSRELTLSLGQGLPGKAWATGVPSWSPSLADDAEFLRASATTEPELTSGGAFPIAVGDRVVGVIDVFSRERIELDDRLTDTLNTLGIQIGQFFVRSAQHQRIVRLTRVYAVLSGINAAIVRIRDRRQLFHEACYIAVREGNFGMAWIGEVVVGTAQVVPLAWAGIGDESGAEPLTLAVGGQSGESAIAEAVRSEQACVVHHLSRRKGGGKRRTEALRRGYRSMIAMPLFVESKVCGVMVLYAEEAEYFTAEERTLLDELANDISFALDYMAKQDQLTYLARHDALTDLPNRAELLDRLRDALQDPVGNGDIVGVVVWDVHRFRHINDTFGRQVGDTLLKALAQRFRAACPHTLNPARIGVDQFACVIRAEHELTDLAHHIEQTTQAVAGQRLMVGGHALHVTLAAGIAVRAHEEDDADTLLRNAEAALRQAKRSGVSYLFYEPEMNAFIARTLFLENRLRQALERKEFVLHYQPKVCAVTGAITGLEALIRWQDPDNGLVSPAVFIPILEETGMIIQVGQWAIQSALADAMRWREMHGITSRVAVNVSSLQLQHKDFVDAIREAVSGWDAAPPLDLEITESMLMADLDGNVKRLEAVRDMGVRIAIDDFGTGYSSLGYLARLPVNALKIDRSFVSSMSMTPEDMTIVSTIISLAHSLDLKVIGEGVETEEQAKFLRLLKCNELQGFLISSPLPPEDLVAFMRPGR